MSKATNININENVKFCDQCNNYTKSDRESFITKERYDELIKNLEITTVFSNYVENLPIDISIGAIIYNQNNKKFLIVKQRNNNFSGCFWGFPKGGPNKNEKNIEHVMFREIMEESGIDLKRITCKYNEIVQVIYKAKRKSTDGKNIIINRIIIYFLITLFYKIILNPIDTYEIEKCEWHNIPSVLQKLKNTYIKSAYYYALKIFSAKHINFY